MVGEKNKSKIRKYFELNENKHTIYKKFEAVAKALLRMKFMRLYVYTQKEGRSQVNYLSL